jgi:hypothetical protein
VAEPVWEAVSARPAGPLRAVVAEHHGYRQRDMPPARHLGLPDLATRGTWDGDQGHDMLMLRALVRDGIVP